MKFAAGLLFGTVVGAAAAILVAPMSGHRLRNSLTKEAKKLAVRATELVPNEWAEMAEEEVTRQILENVTNLRTAGL